MFDNYFEVVLADTPESKKLHYHLRYQVYCLEEGFENPASYPNRLESDRFDDCSAHFLVRSRHSQEWVGAMRLVFGSANELPLSQYSQLHERYRLRENVIYSEVSRVCVIGKYRRGKKRFPSLGHAQANGKIVQTQRQRRQESEIMFGLIRAARVYSMRKGVDDWFFFVSNALARVLRMANLRIEAAGSEANLNGMRRPYYCDLKTLLYDVDGPLAEMFNRAPAYAPYSLYERAKAS